MAHPQQLQFLKSVSSTLSKDYADVKVLEVGSYDVNGSVRHFFPRSTYIGADLIEGPGVDLVCPGDKIAHADNTYDITISCECFEHNPNWISTFKNMARMTRHGGVVIVTCASTGRAEHGTRRTSPDASPGTLALNWDYYRNLTKIDFTENLSLESDFDEYFFLTNQRSCDLYFFGIKAKGQNIFKACIKAIEDACSQDQIRLEKLIDNRLRRERFIPKPMRKWSRKYLEPKDLLASSSRLVIF